jgi:hypothetical protein
MKFSSLISVLATFTAVCAASAGTEDQPFFTMALTVQCNSDEECNNGLPTPFVTQLQDGKRIHNSSIDFAEKDAEFRSHLNYTTHYRTISEIVFDGASDKERQFRVDGMHIWKTKPAEYNLLVSAQLGAVCCLELMHQK